MAPIPDPLLRVPPEIIAEIISRATAGKPVTLAIKDGIWSYSRVSRTWRSIALSSPLFWSTISIRIGYGPLDTDPKSNHYAECIKTVLSRKKNHPLSFDFFYDDHMEYAQNTARSLLKLMVEHALQWREASFTIPKGFLRTLSLVKDRVPRLESLHLYLLEDNSSRVKCFQNAPALRRVSFHSNLLHPQFLPWAQITEYKADYGDFVMPCLKLMPNLLALQLENQHVKKPIGLVLEKLCRLDVSRSPLIRYLTTPALQEIIVNLITELPSIIDLIKRSGCRITALTFEYTLGSIGDTSILIEFFKSLPSLVVLNLSGQLVHNITAIFNLLVPGSINLLPVLTELILPWRHIHSFINSLVPFLKQRGSSNPIKSVIFTGPYHPLPPELLTLQRDGLNVSFTYTYTTRR